MSFDLSFSEFTFYEGGALSTLVPSVYKHALDGHPYLVDDAQEGNLSFHHETIPLLKQQQQSDGNLGAQSINPEGLWRLSVDSWHEGAGQTNYDLADSRPARFRSSKGVDPWTRWELSLLPDTDHLSTTSSTNLGLAPTSTRLFWLDGTAVKYTGNLATVSTMTGTKNWLSITSDGYNVTATDGSDVYQWDRTATSVGSAWNTLNCTLVQWVKGRLMAAQDSAIYNLTSSSAPSAITIATGTISTDFEWVGFAAGKSCIYAAGYQGDKSLIFRMGIKDDASGLDVAVQAGELPDGEVVRAIRSYLGFVLIGTDNGWRFATADANGDLTIGALVETDSPVRCFEGQGSFVWYGLTNYDGTSTGLGRMSLTTILDSHPAYASDLMATAQGNVLDVCTFLGKRVFAVSGSGIYVESDNLVSSGTLDSGLLSFGIPDDKIALGFDLRFRPLAGSVRVSLALDESTMFEVLGTEDTADLTGATWAVGELTGEKFELRSLLTRDVTDTTTGPTVTREVLRMNPTANTGRLIVLPVLLNSSDSIPNQANIPRNVRTEFEFLEALRATRDIVAYQEGARTYAVSLEDFYWFPRSAGYDAQAGAFQGTAVLKLKVVT